MSLWIMTFNVRKSMLNTDKHTILQCNCASRDYLSRIEEEGVFLNYVEINTMTIDKLTSGCTTKLTYLEQENNFHIFY